jgi:hypothetical protein
LYGRKCRTPLYWSETGESQLFGPEIIKETARYVQVVRENLKVAQSRQKSYADTRRWELTFEEGDYADTRRWELTFEEGDYVYLKVSPIRGLRRFKVKGKLSPRSISPFRILEWKGEVAYQLELPVWLSDVRNVFHISIIAIIWLGKKVGREQDGLKG